MSLDDPVTAGPGRPGSMGVVPRLVLPAGAMAASWLASGVPGGPSGMPPGVDKLVHAAAWCVLAGLWLFALAPTTMRPGSRAALAFVLAVAWGAVDEWHQSWVPGRSASIADLAADAAGAGLAGAILLVATWRGRPRAGRSADGRG